MDPNNPEKYLTPLTFAQRIEAKMQFDPDSIREMLAYTCEIKLRTTDPSELEEITAHEASLNELLQRLEF